MIGRYKIEKHDEPFPGFPPGCAYSVSQRVPLTDQFAIVYEAMLTKTQADKAVKALQYADKHKITDLEDLAIFLEEAVYG